MRIHTTATGSAIAEDDAIGPVMQINAIVSAYVMGTFEATLKLQARPTGDPDLDWQTIGDDITAPGIVTAGPIAGDYEYRLLCTAFTSGTVDAYISAMEGS